MGVGADHQVGDVHPAGDRARRARGTAPPGETTTPLAITEVAPGVRMPLGSRWVAYFSPSTTMVWPALWPPLVRTTKSIGLAWWRAGRWPCPCPRRPTGLRARRSRASQPSLCHSAETVGAGKCRSPGTRHRGSCDATLPHRGRLGVRYVSAWTLLVITNADAGTSDEERLAEALAVLREKASVEVAKTSNPGELDGVLHRAGGRTVVVAGGDGSLHAVVTALHKRRELTRRPRPAADGHRQRLRPRQRHPARDRGSGPARAGGRAPQGRPHRRRDRQRRGQQRARRGRRAGQPQGRAVEDPAGRRRRRQGQPRQARLPHRRRCCPRSTRPAGACASSSTARSSTTSTGRC